MVPNLFCLVHRFHPMSEFHFPFPRLYDTEDAFQLMWEFLQWNIVLFVRTTDQPNSREMCNQFCGGFSKCAQFCKKKLWPWNLKCCYGIMLQYNADISFWLDNDWNYFISFCNSLSLPIYNSNCPLNPEISRSGILSWLGATVLNGRDVEKWEFHMKMYKPCKPETKVCTKYS